MFTDSLCYSGCPERYYLNSDSRTCQACPYDCLTCDAEGGCLTCSDLDHRLFVAEVKRCVPIIGFYESDATASRLLLEGLVENKVYKELFGRLLFLNW
jgi:hypothetical protein